MKKKYISVIVVILLAMLFLFFPRTNTMSIIYGNDIEEQILEYSPSSAFSVFNESISCSPESPFNKCVAFQKRDSDDVFLTNSLSSRLSTWVYDTNPAWNVSYLNPPTSYSVGAKAYGFGKTNRLYYTDSCFSSWESFWSSANCSPSGCSGLTQVSNPNNKVILTQQANSVSYQGCPVYVSLTTNPLGTTVKYVGAAYYQQGHGSKIFASIPGYQVSECYPADTKCVGEIFYDCRNNSWYSRGRIEGVCGYTTSVCVNGQQECVDTTLKYCSNGQWNYESNSAQCSQQVGDCTTGQNECDGFTYRQCVNSSWEETVNSSICGYVPIVVEECDSSFEEYCDGFTFVECIEGSVIETPNSSNCDVPVICEEGSFTCSGKEVLVCEDNAYLNYGEVNGYCQIEDTIDIYLISSVVAVIVFGLIGLGLFFRFKKKKRRK